MVLTGVNLFCGVLDAKNYYSLFFFTTGPINKVYNQQRKLIIKWGPDYPGQMRIRDIMAVVGCQSAGLSRRCWSARDQCLKKSIFRSPRVAPRLRKSPLPEIPFQRSLRRDSLCDRLLKSIDNSDTRSLCSAYPALDDRFSRSLLLRFGISMSKCRKVQFSLKLCAQNGRAYIGVPRGRSAPTRARPADRPPRDR